MKVAIYKDGIFVGEQEIPDDMLAKANEVRMWMDKNNLQSFCGLTSSLNSHLRIGELEKQVHQCKSFV